MTREEVQKLEDFFSQGDKQATPIYLDAAAVINNYEHFLESHFAPVRIDATTKVNQSLIWRLKGKTYC